MSTMSSSNIQTTVFYETKDTINKVSEIWRDIAVLLELVPRNTKMSASKLRYSQTRIY